MPTPWKSGEIFHISIGPAINRCPRHTCKVNKGIPQTKDKIKNCTIKLAKNKRKTNEILIGILENEGSMSVTSKLYAENGKSVDVE